MAADQLAEIGLRPDDTAGDAPWSRPALVNPAPVAGMPRGLALIPPRSPCRAGSRASGINRMPVHKRSSAGIRVHLRDHNE